MIRVIFLLILCSTLCLPVEAQILKNMGKALSKETRSGARATRMGSHTLRTTGTIQRSGTKLDPVDLPMSSSLGNKKSAVLATGGLSQTGGPYTTRHLQHAQTGNLTPSTSVNALVNSIQQEIIENEHLLNENAQLRFGGLDFGQRVLFAPVEANPASGFSITIFKTSYQGQEEIFGVIASHALPESYYTLHNSLHRNFQAYVQQPDGDIKEIPGTVVQISPRSMLDISLVKFPQEAQQGLRPLELADAPVQSYEVLYSPGFAAGLPSEETRTVTKLSFLSVQTDQNLPGERYGFCGSPLLDSQGKIKAIHTGTKESADAPQVSYGTHAHFINLLVQAYHQGGQALYDLNIKGHTLARLNVDEYISAISLYDAQGKRLAQKNLEDKFSQTTVESMLESNPQARYIQLTSRKAQWVTDNDGDSILKEDRSKHDTSKRHHWYNLQTKKIEPQRPDIIH